MKIIKNKALNYRLHLFLLLSVAILIFSSPSSGLNYVANGSNWETGNFYNATTSTVFNNGLNVTLGWKPPNLDKGMNLYLTLNISNATQPDSSGQGNSGTVNGANFTANGIVGGAYNFNKSENSYILGNAIGGFDDDNITISMWLYPKGISQNNGQFFDFIPLPSIYIFELSVQGDDFSALATNQSGTAGIKPSCQPWAYDVIGMNTWNFVTFKVTALNNTASNCKVYVNGILKDELNSSLGRIELNNFPTYTVGRGFNGYFNGTIDEVAIYNRSLTSEEILGNYTNYISKGNYTSRAIYFDGFTNWTNISWTTNQPAQTNITMQFRTSNNNVTWSEWFGINGTDFTQQTYFNLSSPSYNLNSSAQYFQFNAKLTTDNNAITPYLTQTIISYVIPSDQIKECPSTLTSRDTLIYNFSVWEEKNLTSITTDFESTFTERISNLSFNVNKYDAHYIPICWYSSNLTTNISVDALIQFQQLSVYPARTYYLIREAINGNSSTINPITKNLYSLFITDASGTKITLFDSANKKVTGFYIFVQKKDITTNSFINVSIMQTDTQGEAFTYLNWYDSLYRFVVYNITNVELTTLQKIIAVNSLSLQLSPTTWADTLKTFNGVTFTPITFNNLTNTYSTTYSAPSSIIRMCLNVIKYSAGKIETLNQTCSTSSSDTLTYTIIRDNATFSASLIGHQSGSDIPSTIDTLINNLAGHPFLAQKLGRYNSVYLVLFVVGTTIALGLGGPPSLIPLLAVTGVSISYLIGLLDTGFFAIITLLIMAFLIYGRLKQ